MEAYGPETYGAHIADLYDERYASRDPAREVERLAALAGAGPVLELGVGTGRVAIPLAQHLAPRSVAVHGIDASEPMVAQLRARDGGHLVTVAMGDMRAVDAPAEQYALVYVVFNTFYALLDQDAQVDCFANVAQRLAPGGRFLIEAFVPDLARYDEHDQSTVATSIEVDAVELDVFRHDPVTQRVEGHHVHLGASGTRLLPLVLRYAFPSELDLMARLAGLTLESRAGGYAGEPFTATSMSHVSVYRKGTT
jgi:SAM-dependent methyltransferase